MGRPLLLFQACAFLLVTLWWAPAKAESDRVQALVSRAREARLHERKTWRRLLHYRDTLFGGESEVDDEAFFLAPEGKEDLEAELEATLRAFFEPQAPLPPPPDDPEKPPEASPHAACRFPARLHWLAKELRFDIARLPVKACPRLADFIRRMRAKGVSLVFSSYHLSAPASTFGHTLLRIHKHRLGSDGRAQDLLDDGINFAATRTDSFPLLYVVRGLTGAYEGYFRRMPYSYKIREYNDFENRDLWEYRLDLSPEVLGQLVLHIWELADAKFDYYFLTENCSYHVLGALEAADPTLDLLEHIRDPVVPVDTVRALYANPGLVREVTFRPSAHRVFHTRVADLDGDVTAFIDELASDPDAAIPEGWSEDLRIRALDAAVDLVELRHAKEVLTEPESEPSKAKQRLLERRAAIQRPSPRLVVHRPEAEEPTGGHHSARIGLGAGASWSAGETPDLSAPFTDLNLRLVLHDLADPSLGYPELAQMEFSPTRLRYLPKQRTFRLDDYSLVSLVSLRPFGRFTQKASWLARVGTQTRDDPGCGPAGCIAAHAQMASGVTLATAGKAFALFGLLDSRIWAGPHIQGANDAPVLAGVGPLGGVRVRMHHRLIALVRAGMVWFPWQPRVREHEVEAFLRWGLTNSFSLSMEGRLRGEMLEGRLVGYVYF